MQFVWAYFIELNNGRTSNGFGPNPIQYSEMEAYFRLIGIDITEWEIQVIKRLDNLKLKMHADEAEKEAKKQQSKSKKPS